MKQKKINKMMKLRVVGMQGAQEFVEIKTVTMPSENGEITVLQGHENMIVKLNDGTITFTNAKGTVKTIEIDNSVALIKNNLIEII